MNTTEYLYSENRCIQIIVKKKHEPHFLAFKCWRSIKPKPSTVFIFGTLIWQSLPGAGRVVIWGGETANISASLNRSQEAVVLWAFFVLFFCPMFDPSCEEGPRNEVLQHLKAAAALGIKMPLKHFSSNYRASSKTSIKSHRSCWGSWLKTTEHRCRLGAEAIGLCSTQSERYFLLHFSIAQRHWLLQRATALQ